MADDDKLGADAAQPDAAAVQLDAADVVFHYVRSKHFRVIHADGAHGGVTVRGYVSVNFYSERGLTPPRTTLAVDAESGETKETAGETRGHVVRELEVSVMLDEQSTNQLVVWLQQKLVQLQQVKDMKKQQQEKAKK